MHGQGGPSNGPHTGACSDELIVAATPPGVSQCAWSSLLPLLSFTEAEFQQAGLLQPNGLQTQLGGTSSRDSGIVLQYVRNETLSESAGASSSCFPRTSDLSAIQSLLPVDPDLDSHPLNGNSLQTQAPSGQQQEASPWQHVNQPIHKSRQNSHYQKRSRLRQKVRAEAVEAQLAETTMELKTLRLQKQELGRLLHQAQLRSVSSNSKPKGAASPGQIQAVPRGQTHPDDEFGNGPPLNISIPGKECQLSIHDLAHLPLQKFQALWTDYIQALECCLASLQSQHDPVVNQKMQQLVFEAMRLRGQFVRLNPKNPFSPHLAEGAQHAQHTESVAQTAAHSAVTGSSVPPNLLTVLRLSPKQIQDLMFLRRTFFLRRQELAVQRAKLTQQMQDGSASTLAHATRVNEIADSLCDNAAADHQNAHRFPWATYFGVLSVKQSAEVLVHCNALVEDLLDHIAQQYGFPTKQQTIDNAREGLTCTDWQHYWSYTQDVNPYVALRPENVPIGASKQPAKAQLLLY